MSSSSSSLNNHNSNSNNNNNGYNSNGAGRRRGRRPYPRDRGFVQLNVGGTVFSTSKSTLMTHSIYFEARFSNEWDTEYNHHYDTNDSSNIDDHQENGDSNYHFNDGNGPPPTLLFLDQDPQAFSILLNFMRQGFIKHTDITESVLMLADFLGMEELLRAVKYVVMSNMSFDGCFISKEEACQRFDLLYGGGILGAIMEGILPDRILPPSMNNASSSTSEEEVVRKEYARLSIGNGNIMDHSISDDYDPIYVSLCVTVEAPTYIVAASMAAVRNKEFLSATSNGNSGSSSGSLNNNNYNSNAASMSSSNGKTSTHDPSDEQNIHNIAPTMVPNCHTFLDAINWLHQNGFVEIESEKFDKVDIESQDATIWFSRRVFRPPNKNNTRTNFSHQHYHHRNPNHCIIFSKNSSNTTSTAKKTSRLSTTNTERRQFAAVISHSLDLGGGARLLADTGYKRQLFVSKDVGWGHLARQHVLSNLTEPAGVCEAVSRVNWLAQQGYTQREHSLEQVYTELTKRSLLLLHSDIDTRRVALTLLSRKI